MPYPLRGRTPKKVAYQGSAECTDEYSEDGTLIGLYLLIAGIILVVFTLIGVFLQKHCGNQVSETSRQTSERPLTLPLGYQHERACPVTLGWISVVAPSDAESPPPSRGPQ